MKKINLFVAAFAALAVVSCQTQDDSPAPIPNNGEPITVNLKIGTDDNLTRSIEPTADGQLILLNDGLIFFLDANGYVVNTVALDKAVITSATGQDCLNIKATAKEVLVAANLDKYGLTLTLAGLTTKAAIRNTIKAISNTAILPKDAIVTNMAETVASTPPFNGMITVVGSTGTARVLVAPLFSRIQIADVKTDDPAIVSFKLAGVYVDNYYPSFFLATDKGGAGTIKTVGLLGDDLGKSPTPTVLFDVPAAPVLSVAKKVTAMMAATTPAPNSLWAYNVTPNLGGVVNAPRVIVKLVDVVVKDPSGGGNITIAGPKYLTIKSFVDGTKPVDNFVAGNVYNVPTDAFNFKLTDLGDTPNASNINVVVIVKVKPWALVSVTPQL
ncbi:MAG: hypothetical protein RSB29_05005 [Alistipes sp.]